MESKIQGGLERNLSIPFTVFKGTPNKSSLSVELYRAITSQRFGVFTICVLKNGNLASGSGDYSIKIHDITTGKIILNLSGHKGSVDYITELNNGHLASSSRDKTIKIWDLTLEENQCINTISVHYGWVNKIIQLRGGKMASCSDDKKIKIFTSSPPYDYLQTLIAHSDCVRTIIELKNKEIIVSGGFDGKIIFWNSNTYHCEKSIEGGACRTNNSLIQISDVRLIFADRSKVGVVNILTIQIEIAVTLGNFEVLCICQLDKENILCGLSDGGILNVGIETFEISFRKEKFHEDDIYSIITHNGYLISCSDSKDSRVNVWKIKST